MNTTVCIIDGDPAVRDSLATMVGLTGHEARTFATGGEFLSQADADKQQCVVCEADLPDTSGIDVFKAVRQKNPEAHFALLVSRTSDGIAAQASRLGIDHVFFKPLVNRRLIAFVSELDKPPR